MIEQRQRDRGGRRHQRRRRAGSRLRCAGRCPAAPSHPSPRGRSPAPTVPCRQSPRTIRHAVVIVSPRRAPACRNRPWSPRSAAASAVALAVCSARSGASTLVSIVVGIVIGLDQRVAQRDQLRLVAIAAERVAEADFAAGEPHRGARHRGFAEIERRAVAADPAAHHHQPVLRLAQRRARRQRDRRQQRGDAIRRSACASTAIAACAGLCAGFGRARSSFALACLEVVYDIRQLHSDAP